MNNASINLSEHFTLAEMCKTNVKLKNVPNEAQVENLKRLCGWLEMLRRRYNERYGEGNDPTLSFVGNAIVWPAFLWIVALQGLF